MNFIALKSKPFRLYYGGVIFAVNGLWMLMVCVGWVAWVQSGSAAFVGVVATVAMLPAIFLGPFFGVWIDRIDIRIAYYGTNLGMLTAASVLLILEFFGLTTKWAVMGIALFMGVVASAHGPTRLSLGPRLVPREYVSSVVTMAALNFNTARFISPAICGLIIDGFGVATALATVVVLYVPNLFIIWALQPRDRGTTVEPEPFFTAFAAGIQYLMDRKALLWILLLSGLYNATVRGTTELMSVIADGGFGRGAAGLGQLGSAVGSGAIVAAVSKGMSRAGAFAQLSTPILMVAVFSAFALATLGGTSNWHTALLAAAAIGFCSTFLGITVQSVIQSDLPDDMRARVMSLWVMVAMGSPAIGAISIGSMAHATSMGWATVLAAGFALAGYLVIYLCALRKAPNA